MLARHRCVKRVLGDADRAPTPEELEKMKALHRTSYAGWRRSEISTALIYPSGSLRKTDELIELAKIAAQHGGIYGTHNAQRKARAKLPQLRKPSASA